MPKEDSLLPEPPPMRVDMARLLGWGMAAWGVALVVVLAVPSLHAGERSWWPWTCAAAIFGGAVAWVYVRRGRGNAAGA